MEDKALSLFFSYVPSAVFKPFYDVFKSQSQKVINAWPWDGLDCFIAWLARNLTSQSRCFRTDSSLHISLPPTLLSSCEITEAAMSPQRVSSDRDLPTREQPAAGAAKLFSMRRPLRYCGHSQEGSLSPLHVRRGSLFRKVKGDRGLTLSLSVCRAQLSATAVCICVRLSASVLRGMRGLHIWERLTRL